MAVKDKKQDEDDGDSPFMPLDEVMRKLKAGPLNFGLFLTGDRKNPALLAAHKRKNPTILGKQAKKQAGTAKGAFGTLILESGELKFQCENEDPPASLKKNVRMMLREAGLAKLKPRILLPGGIEMEGGDEDDETDGEEGMTDASADQIASDAEAPAENTQMAAVEARWAVLKPVLEGMAAGPDPRLAGQVAKLLRLMELTIAAQEAAKAEGALVIADRLAAQAGGTGAGNATVLASASSSGAAAEAPPEATDPGEAERAAKVAKTAELDGLTNEKLAETPMTVGNVDDLFTDEYMEKLRVEPIKGEGDPDLKVLMKEIEAGISGDRREEVMKELETIVGAPPSWQDLDADYGRFLVLRKQRDVIGADQPDPIESVDEEKHPDFTGSRGQLMFGKVLGDAFGIHEVFASLLSPTGGLVGPGNWLIEGHVDALHLDPDNPVALHGTVHDAAGYLKNYHGEGPGYDYRGGDVVAGLKGTEDPLGGQISGISYWVNKDVERSIDELSQTVEDELQSARDAVEDEIQQQIEEARDNVSAGLGDAESTAQGYIDQAQDEMNQLIDNAPPELRDKIGGLQELINQQIDETQRDISDAVSTIQDEVSEQADNLQHGASEVVDLLHEQLGRQVELGRQVVHEVADKAGDMIRTEIDTTVRNVLVVVELGTAAVDGAKRAGRAAVEEFKAGTKRLGEMADTAQEKLSAAWNSIWN